jgi:Zn-finger nucleic acid-binding protein
MSKPLRCPKCADAMHSGGGNQGPVFSCYGCWGLWVDTSALSETEEQYPAGNRLHAALQELDVSEMETTRLQCATSCGGGLLAVHCRGVAIEFCSECGGVFLDRGEREKLTGRDFAPAVASLRHGVSTGTNGVSGALDGALLAGEILAGLAELVGDL